MSISITRSRSLRLIAGVTLVLVLAMIGFTGSGVTQAHAADARNCLGAWPMYSPGGVFRGEVTTGTCRNQYTNARVEVFFRPYGSSQSRYVDSGWKRTNDVGGSFNEADVTCRSGRLYQFNVVGLGYVGGRTYSKSTGWVTARC